MDDGQKSLEEFFDKNLRNIELDNPTRDFTKNVMQEIGSLQSVTSYQPVIPKKILITIAVTLAILMVYFGFTADLTQNDWFGLISKPEWFSGLSLPKLEISFSKTVLYAVCAMGFMVLIQTALLKDYLNKRLI